jgi:hypothetical protein
MNDQNKKYLDHELLQDAAKAAGYKQYYSHWLGRDSFVTYEEEDYSEVKKRRVVVEKTMDWNPLSDDGDALRLAVKLSIHIIQINDRETWSAWIDANGLLQTEPAEDDYAATRRAIVRSAAAIGRNMA